MDLQPQGVVINVAEQYAGEIVFEFFVNGKKLLLLVDANDVKNLSEIQIPRIRNGTVADVSFSLIEEVTNARGDISLEIGEFLIVPEECVDDGGKASFKLCAEDLFRVPRRKYIGKQALPVSRVQNERSVENNDGKAEA